MGLRGDFCAFHLLRQQALHLCACVVYAHVGEEDNPQGFLPDFRIELPSPIGEPELELVELKIIGAVKSGACAMRKKDVERGNALLVLTEEYRRPLAAMDQKYHGTALWEVGPLGRRRKGSGHWCIPEGQQGLAHFA